MKIKQLLQSVTSEAAAESITPSEYVLNGVLGRDAGILAVLKTKSTANSDSDTLAKLNVITDSDSDIEKSQTAAVIYKGVQDCRRSAVGL